MKDGDGIYSEKSINWKYMLEVVAEKKTFLYGKNGNSTGIFTS